MIFGLSDDLAVKIYLRIYTNSSDKNFSTAFHDMSAGQNHRIHRNAFFNLKSFEDQRSVR